VEEEKNERWTTSGHHGQPMVNTTARGGCKTVACSSSLVFVAMDA